MCDFFAWNIIFSEPIYEKAYVKALKQPWKKGLQKLCSIAKALIILCNCNLKLWRLRTPASYANMSDKLVILIPSAKAFYIRRVS